jgi:5-(carboxyamino)imidazole ribonucleotide mutase
VRSRVSIRKLGRKTGSMDQPLVIILMGSASDLTHVGKIASVLESKFGIPSEQHIASAHKTPHRLLELIAGYESDPRAKVFITVAGRSNALSGMVDANVSSPVIACPPLSEAFGGSDIFSSLRMPSGVAPLVVLDTENAALAAAKILSLASSDIRKKVATYQKAHKQKLVDAENELNSEV